jgi:hypothetical protein
MSDIVDAVGRRAALPRRHGVDKRLRKRGRGRRSPPGALKGIERAALLGFGAAREHNALKRDVARTKDGVHLTERQYGQFLRSIPLPEGAKIDEARAKFENGILEVTVPVQEQQSKRREIPIEASSANTASSSGKAA